MSDRGWSRCYRSFIMLVGAPVPGINGFSRDQAPLRMDPPGPVGAGRMAATVFRAIAAKWCYKAMGNL